MRASTTKANGAETPATRRRVVYASGDIKSEPAFCNPVNLVGVMGAGLARQVRDRWPEAVPPYLRACRNGTLRAGRVLRFRTPEGTWILQTPTKRDWREPSDLALVTSSIGALATEAAELGLESLAVPRLGCGLGGLAWDDVHEVLLRTWQSHGTELRVYGTLPRSG